MGKTREHYMALSCRNTINPTNMTASSNKLRVITEALLNLLYGSILFPPVTFSPSYCHPSPFITDLPLDKILSQQSIKNYTVEYPVS